jgi:hypothetical protein
LLFQAKERIESVANMASINFPKEELDIIQRWRDIKAFEKQVGICTSKFAVFVY